jgi:hypothetical protein
MDIASPGFPSSSGPGQNCKWKFVTTPGAQVMVNFKEMDMLKPLDSQCSRQSVWLSDPNSAHHSLTGRNNPLEFCGDLVPNYPGPSTFTSAGNSLDIAYRTSHLNIQRGRGFKAAVSALNPLCSPIKIYLSYHNHTCHHVCGQTVHRPPTTPKPSCPWPTLKFHVLDQNTSLPIADAALDLTNYRHKNQAKVKVVTHYTGEHGVAKNIRFAEGHVKVTATAEGYESWTAEFEFTCKHGGCNKCEMVKIIELPKLVEETYCENVEGTIRIKDAANNESLAQAMVDVYKIPLECEIPTGEALVPTTTTEAPNTTPMKPVTVTHTTEQQLTATVALRSDDKLGTTNDNESQTTTQEESQTTTEEESQTTTEEEYLTSLFRPNGIGNVALNRQLRIANGALNRQSPPNCTEVKVVENEKTNDVGTLQFPSLHSAKHQTPKISNHSNNRLCQL